jgi:hypothetical protein
VNDWVSSHKVAVQQVSNTRGLTSGTHNHNDGRENDRKEPMGQDNKQGVKHRPDEKVFPDLVDHAGLIDGIVLGVYGQRRLTPSRLVAISPSRPVGGPDRKYSQAANGICKPTGNPFQELFAVMGRFRRFPRVPPVTVKIRSQAVPLSCAQVELVTAALMRQRYRLVVSAVELSFDVTGY